MQHMFINSMDANYIFTPDVWVIRRRTFGEHHIIVLKLSIYTVPRSYNCLIAILF